MALKTQFNNVDITFFLPAIGYKLLFELVLPFPNINIFFGSHEWMLFEGSAYSVLIYMYMYMAGPLLLEGM